MQPSRISAALLGFAALTTCTIASASAALTTVDFTELSQSAVITETPGPGGFPSYSAIATDNLSIGGVFVVTAQNPFEGVLAPRFTPTEIHVSERSGILGFMPPATSPFMAIEFSATFSSKFDGSISFGGLEDDYLIRVSTIPRGEIYFGLAGNFVGGTNGEFTTVELPRQTIFRTGSTEIGPFERVSQITAYSVQIIPEPSAALLFVATACSMMLGRRRKPQPIAQL